jgi:hypothetical protein
MAEVSVEYMDDDEGYVPTVTEVENSWKKGREMEVTLREPCLDQVFNARYNCSAAAKVARYQG